ncbi:hypothetical protein ADK41_00830 [Streptomyces caelestis]|uniref:Uncharacterized protein n=1 Tax=Streptomyces caelestis TaxID=36816 RepID=A0A0M9XBD8_9ACTN|nr:hypothetical protein ADK41_00830 [Streptomyces caelestis]
MSAASAAVQVQGADVRRIVVQPRIRLSCSVRTHISLWRRVQLLASSWTCRPQLRQFGSWLAFIQSERAWIIAVRPVWSAGVAGRIESMGSAPVCSSMSGRQSGGPVGTLDVYCLVGTPVL